MNSRHYRRCVAGVVAVIYSLCLFCASPAFAGTDSIVDKWADKRFAQFFKREWVSARFIQTVYERGQRVSQTAGKVVLRRPDSIRWEYLGDDAQIFILRKHLLFQYDAQIKQAVVNEVDESIADTPLLWLLGSRLDKFQFKSLKKSHLKNDSLERFEVIPLSTKSSFSRMEISLDGAELRHLIFFDTDERQTKITFEKAPATRNPFRIKLPADVDVIGDVRPFVSKSQ